jgi:Cd2+/Zn2+-exporting ATPase
MGIADDPREDAAPALRALRELGVQQLVMLTGDRRATAEAAASNMALTNIRAEFLPEDKVGQIKELSRSAGPVAMVGDGVNDAPALAAADVGIAMGAAGTDAAIETADVALMGDHLCRLPDLVALGRRTVQTVRFNAALALTSKAVVVVIAIAGYSSLSMAILADMGASLAVTFISLGLLRHRWLKVDDPDFHPQTLSVHASSAH